MAQINLNDESFDAKEGGKAFNGGVAGVVENVKISLEKKKPEDKEKAPDYKVVFTDANGAKAEMPFWYIKEATSYKSVDQLVQAQGKVLKHLIHAVLGSSTQFPPFNNPVEMLDGCLKLMKTKQNPNDLFRAFANYGTPDYPKSFIQIRTWVPFVEIGSAEAGRLVAGNNDNLVRLQPDNAGATSAGSAPAADANDGW